MSSIVTFYSYKGGVGRSMALANIAYVLARRGLKILMIDWDLEAPGLEKYFSYYDKDDSGNGLLALMMDAEKEGTDYKKYLWKITLDDTTSIDLLHSGKMKDENFSNNLENFDWNSFFSEHDGGLFLEDLRDQWKKDYDMVLIDSRTGLSDSSGICTIFLPDVIVPMFTANYQSLDGVKDIVRLAQEARQKLENDRMPLTILPVPSRFGARAEFQVSQEWLDRFAQTLNEFYSDWLPKWITPKEVLEKIKIPQVDYFSFGEKLAVVEHGTSDPEGMGFVYAKIAGLLASDLSDVRSFIGGEYDLKKKEYEKQASVVAERSSGYVAERSSRVLDGTPYSNVRQNKGGRYEYDVFISYAMGNDILAQWLDGIFLPLVSNYAMEELGTKLSFFMDRQEIKSGESISLAIREALYRSKILLSIVTPRYFVTRSALTEWLTFEQRAQFVAGPQVLIIPVVVFGGGHITYPGFKNILYLDLSKYFNLKISEKSREYFELTQQIVTNLVPALVSAIRNAPVFNPDWPVPDDGYVARVLAENTPLDLGRPTL